MNISYPVQFPCPTWSYGTDTVTYPIRTQFDNGWTRQRRAFPQTGMSANLTFLMTTVMFEKWNDWFAANGWDWFYIGLDNGEGTVQQEVRLMTPPTWGYDAYDNVVAQVVVEVSPEMSCREADPLGPMYKCDAVASALTNTSLWYDWTVGGPVPSLGVNDVREKQGTISSDDATKLDQTIKVYTNQDPEQPATIVDSCTGFQWGLVAGSGKTRADVTGNYVAGNENEFTMGMLCSVNSDSGPSFILDVKNGLNTGVSSYCQVFATNGTFAFRKEHSITAPIPAGGGDFVMILTYFCPSPVFGEYKGQLRGYVDGVLVAEQLDSNDFRFHTILGGESTGVITGGNQLQAIAYQFYDNHAWSQEEITAFQAVVEQNRVQE